MRNVQVDENGELHCWNCGARAFTHKRTFRAKAIGLTAAVTTVGILAAAPLGTKKKLQCQVCGKYNDVGTADPFSPAGRDSSEHRSQDDSGLQMLSGRSPHQITDQIVALVDKLADLRAAGLGWELEAYDDALLVVRRNRVPGELIVPFDELVGSVLEPPVLARPGSLSLLTRADPEPPIGPAALSSDPYTLMYAPPAHEAMNQLDSLIALVAERNLLLAEGDLVFPDSDGLPGEVVDPPSALQRLEALAEMHRRGLISDDQFEAKQQLILDEL